MADDLLEGNVEALARYLEAGNIPSAELCAAVAQFIREGRIVGDRLEDLPITEFAQKKGSRDRWLGAWLWARRICISGETLESAIAEAITVRRFPVSEATCRRASAGFRQDVIEGEFLRCFWATVVLRFVVSDLCAEFSLDRSAMLSMIEPAQKLRAIFEMGK